MFRDPITTAVDPVARQAASAAQSTANAANTAAAAAQTAANQANTAAAAAQTAADNSLQVASARNHVFVQSNQPTTSTLDDLWIDPANGNRVKSWDGTSWQPVAYGTQALASAAITTDLLAAGAVGAGKIAAGAVQAGSIAAGAVQAAAIAAGAVDASKIAANTIQAGNIAAGAIQTAALAAGAVDATKLTATAIDGKTITGATLTGGTVTGALVRATGSGDVSETSTAHALQAGPSAGLNIAIDGNEIMARDGSVSPSVAGPLWVHNPRSGFAQENVGTALTRKDYVDGKAAGGSVSITPSAANTPTKATITFGKTFASAPIVVATADTAVPGTQVTGVGAANVTTTGCDIYVTRTNTTATPVHWLAYLP